MFNLLNDVAGLGHKAFPVSASLDKTVFAFHFLTLFMPLNIEVMHDN